METPQPDSLTMYRNGFIEFNEQGRLITATIDGVSKDFDSMLDAAIWIESCSDRKDESLGV